MNKIIFIFALLLSLPVNAGVATCATISDHDSRMMCMASVTGNVTYCTSIRESDLRARCYASLGK